jgi:spermidine synthase
VIRPGGARALVVGLGAGVAARALRARGAAVDVVELHPEVLGAAARFFGAAPARGEAARAADAWDAAGALEAAAYDYIVLDVFAGGVSAPRRLASAAFLRRLGRALAPRGVLAVNVFATRAGAARAACLLRSAFAAARVFDAEPTSPPGAPARNYVLFASDDAAALLGARLEGAGAGAADPLEAATLDGLSAAEVPREALGARCGEVGGGGAAWAGDHAERAAIAAAHWRAMRDQFGDAFWRA